jgi:hypothetical protein
METDLMKTLAFAAVAVLLTAPTFAEPFTLMIWETPDQIALRTETTAAGQAYWGGYMAFAEEAGAAGVLVGGAPLVTDAASIVTLGAAPAATGPLRLGGYFQIDVPDLAAAKDRAAKLPASQTGAVAIHPGYPVPGM